MPTKRLLSFHELTELMECLNDPARVRILHLLLHHKRALVQADFQKVMDATQTKIGRHMTYLKYRNLLTTDRHGYYIYFDLNPSYEPILTQLFSFTDADELNKDKLRFEQLSKKGELHLDAPKNKF